MGDPKKPKKKYSVPGHPWEKERIDEEKKLLKDYGLKNKMEIWKMSSVLKNFAKQAKNLIAATTIHAGVEKSQLLRKLSSRGLMQESSKIEDVLSITLKDILERRLQTQVFRKNLARSIKQARQFIIHGHIVIGDKKITSPSYLVTKQEGALINFLSSSALSVAEHPERAVQQKIREEKSEKKADKKLGAKQDKKKTEKKERRKKPWQKQEGKKKKKAEKKAVKGEKK